jgi:muramidase (phage lysozyme)
MPYRFGPYFPFRRDNRKPDGTWDAPDATEDNIKGTSVDPHEPMWPRWRKTPPLYGEGEFVTDEPFFDIDEITQKAEFYPSGRPLIDKNVGGNPASRQRVGDMPGANLWRRRLLVGPVPERVPSRTSPEEEIGQPSAELPAAPFEDRVEQEQRPIQVAGPVPIGAAPRQRVYSADQQTANYFAAEGYLRDPKVRAFLDTIAWAEGGDYDILFGGRRFTNYARFPTPRGAAGRYQFLPSTYNEVSPKLGLSDFSPHTQDLLAVQNLVDRGIINQVVAGNLDGALAGASRIWASLPQSPTQGGYYDRPQYGNQRARPYADLRARFDMEMARDRSTYPTR